MAKFYKIREFDNLREMVEQSAEIFADRNAFEIKRGGKHYFITYPEYLERINGFSTALIDAGYKDNSIAVCAANCYEYCLSYLSIMTSGNVIVPVDKELHEDDILNILSVSEAKMLICDKAFLERFDITKLDGIRLLCIDKPEDKFADIESFDSFMNKGIELNKAGKCLYKDITQDVEKMCVLLFTSGTTGTSKGVMLCQRNFIFEIKAAMKVVKIYPEDCGISLLPLHHTFESSIMVFFAPYVGGKVTFCEGFKYVLRNMKEFNPSVFVAVPLVLETVYNRIMKEINKKKHGRTKYKIGTALCKGASKLHIDLKKIIFKEIQETFGGNMRLIICGGAPVPPHIVEAFDSFGIQVLVGYGLTECAPLVTLNNDHLRTTDTVGRPLPGTEVKILNPDEDGIGEIIVKGDMVMLGYYKNQEATDEVIDKDGFFHTGDLGFVDKKGCFHITGRCKNVIVTSNGKNIFPEELEYHLCKSIFVSSAMIEGVTDKRGELSVHAQIFPDKAEIEEYLDKEVSNEEIEAVIKKVVDEVNNSVPGFKRIKSFTVRETDFIMTTTKKIKRSAN